MIRRHPHVFGSPEQRAAGAAPGFWERAKAAEKDETAAERARKAGSDVASRDAPSPLPSMGRGRGWGEEAGARPPTAGADHLSDPDGRHDHPVAYPSTPSPSPPGGGEHVGSILADVPIAMPALTRAVKLQNKAAKVGFDWPSLTPVLAKLKEELAELEEVIDARSTPDRPSGSDANPDAVAEEFGDLLFVIANVARHLKLDPEAALRSANAKFIRRFRYIEERLSEQGRTPAQSNLAEMDALWDEAKTKGP